MKRIFVFILFTRCLLITAYCQVKITKTTGQKTYAGMGGVFMNYTIGFKSKNSTMIEIDSIKCSADSASIKFSFTRFEPCCRNEIIFGYALSKPERCRTCPDILPNPYNLTQGVIIYYRRENKKYFFKIKKFKQLPDLRTP